MTLYLRDKYGNNIVDLELNKSMPNIDLRVVVDIEAYSNLLLNNLEHKEEVIATFSNISNLRGWLWEYYYPKFGDSPDNYKDILNRIKDIFVETAYRFNLYSVTD